MIVTCGYQLSHFLFYITRASLYLVKQAKTTSLKFGRFLFYITRASVYLVKQAKTTSLKFSRRSRLSLVTKF